MRAKKKSWGNLKARWVPHDTRDQVVDFVRTWSDKTELPTSRLVRWVGVGRSKFYDWIGRFGKVNEHNAWIPRDHWLTADERDRICAFTRANPLEGYRRLAFMMLDADVVACSPSSVYRVLKQAGLLAGDTPAMSKKGTGFVQPLAPHEHWHIDISYLNIAGTFYFQCSVIDGCSRFVVHWEIREKMEENDVEIILQRAREKFPEAKPRIISDNGPQFIAKDFKEFIRVAGMTHVKTSPYYPQSNGKIERWHKTLKGECIRVQVPLSLDDATRLVTHFVTHYNEVRLHSAIGYVAPRVRLENRHLEVFAERDRKLAAARELRQQKRQAHADAAGQRSPAPKTTPPMPRLDFAAIRAAITMRDVLQLLGFQPHTLHGSQQRGACPLHGTSQGTARCFSVNLEQQVFHCFKCGRSGNQLDLWAYATRQTPCDAALDLCRQRCIAVPVLSQNREEEPVENPQPIP